jgi:hypothetical protein
MLWRCIVRDLGPNAKCGIMQTLLVFFFFFLDKLGIERLNRKTADTGIMDVDGLGERYFESLTKRSS